MTDYVLTSEQEEQLKNFWNSKSKESDAPSIKDCCGFLWPNESVGPRDPRVISIKKFLSSLFPSIQPKSKVDSVAITELTDEQKEVILKNINTKYSAIDYTDLVFPNGSNQNRPGGTNYRAVKAFVDSLPKTLFGASSKKDAILKYSPPTTVYEAADLVNRSVYKAVDMTKLAKQMDVQEMLFSLIKFLNTFRFGLTYEGYEDETEKALFYTSFVKYVWDKPDLSEEEIDLYLNLCIDIVSCERIKKEEAFLLRTREGIANDTDGRKISMSIVESLADLRSERDANQKRQSDLIKTLQGKRADRVAEKKMANQSVLQLVSAWRDAEQRSRIIKFADERKEVVKQELARLDSMELFKAEMWGVNAESFDYVPSSDNVIEVQEAS